MPEAERPPDPPCPSSGATLLVTPVAYSLFEQMQNAHGVSRAFGWLRLTA